MVKHNVEHVETCGLIRKCGLCSRWRYGRGTTVLQYKCANNYTDSLLCSWNSSWKLTRITLALVQNFELFNKIGSQTHWICTSFCLQIRLPGYHTILYFKISSKSYLNACFLGDGLIDGHCARGFIYYPYCSWRYPNPNPALQVSTTNTAHIYTHSLVTKHQVRTACENAQY